MTVGGVTITVWDVLSGLSFVILCSVANNRARDIGRWTYLSRIAGMNVEGPGQRRKYIVGVVAFVGVWLRFFGIVAVLLIRGLHVITYSMGSWLADHSVNASWAAFAYQSPLTVIISLVYGFGVICLAAWATMWCLIQWHANRWEKIHQQILQERKETSAVAAET